MPNEEEEEEDDISTLDNNSTNHRELVTINVMNEHGEPIKDLDKTRWAIYSLDRPMLL